MPRLPVDTVSIASGYQDPRRNPTHYGIDLAGKAGDEVFAPESGRVVIAHVSADPTRADNTTLPASAGDSWARFQGYGPGVVVIRGDSGKYHLLAHLGAVAIAAGDAVPEGAYVGNMTTHVGRSGPHVHWEVRTVAVDDGPATRSQFTIDPLVWVASTASRPRESRGLIVWLLLLWAVSRLR